VSMSGLSEPFHVFSSVSSAGISALRFCLNQAAVVFVLRFLIGSGTGRRLATVAQTSIRGLATARTCVVAGLPRT
jgi:hypothetical protein